MRFSNEFAMDDLKELYQEIILDHNKHPKNFRRLERANRQAEGYNPLCGDRYNLSLRVENGVIEDIAFEGAGCAISKAAASVMTSEIKGKTVSQARELFKEYQALVTGALAAEEEVGALGDMAAFCGVREFPVRVKCATLAWHALMSALETPASTTVSPESEQERV